MVDRVLKAQLDRRLNLDNPPAVLGDENGVIYDNPVNRKGYIRVRKKTAAGLSKAFSVRLGRNFSMVMTPGAALRLGWEDGELVALGPDVPGQIAVGSDPNANNAANRPLNKFVPTSALVPLLSTPKSPESSYVSVASLIYIEDRTAKHFYASADDGSGGLKGEIDLTSHIPSAGNHRLIGLFKKSDETLEVCTSTTQTMDIPIDLTDLQEVLDNSSAGSRPSTVYLLKDAQTVITQADVWLDFRQLFNDSSTGYARALFTQTASATVANTVTETTVTAAGVGTLTLPANYFRIGTSLKIIATGYISDTGTPTLNIRFKLGSTTICSTGAVALAGTISNNLWRVEVELTCRTVGATGTVIAQGKFEYDESTHAGTTEGMVSTATTTIDTTATQAVNLTVEWGTANASNTITCTNLALEALR